MTTKYFYAWVGDINCTFGTPNTKTGRYSLYGDIKTFRTRQERDSFVKNYYDNVNPNFRAYSVNKKSARQFCLGMSVALYNAMFDMIDISC